jgi:hypothetical protein
MIIYARIGSSEQIVVPDELKVKIPNDMIPMREERPDVDYIAEEDGTWKHKEEEETLEQEEDTPKE